MSTLEKILGFLLGLLGVAYVVKSKQADKAKLDAFKATTNAQTTEDTAKIVIAEAKTATAKEAYEKAISDLPPDSKYQ